MADEPKTSDRLVVDETVEEDRLEKDAAGRPKALIVGALLVPALLILAMWYFATQTNELDDDPPPSITVEVEPDA
jgi:hypothetical protein